MSTNFSEDDWRSEFEQWWDSMATAPGYSLTELREQRMAAMAAWKEAILRMVAGTIAVIPEGKPSIPDKQILHQRSQS
jgi:hypothetical protein